MNIDGVQGWFNFDDFYNFAADRLPNGGQVVELGPWLGRSTIHLAQALQARGKKDCHITCVDTWEGTKTRGEDEIFGWIIKNLPKPAFEVFWDHMVAFKVESLISAIQNDSIAAANAVADGTIDFIFHDTDHTYEHVIQELRAWRPKLKPGGLWGGHDYGVDGVGKAVNEAVPNVRTMGPCWWATV